MVFRVQQKALRKYSGILQDAGFLSNQIWLVSPSEQTELNRLTTELRGIGISEEEIYYYENELHNQESKLPPWEKLLREADFDHLL